MANRIYTEIRLSHKSDDERIEFKDKATLQASKLGLNVAEYIRMIIELDAATGLIQKLKGDKSPMDALNELKKTIAECKN